MMTAMMNAPRRPPSPKALPMRSTRAVSRPKRIAVFTVFAMTDHCGLAHTQPFTLGRRARPRSSIERPRISRPLYTSERLFHEPVARRPDRVVDSRRAVGRDVAGRRAGADGPDAAHPGAAAIPAAESALVAAALVNHAAALVDHAATDGRPEGARAASACSGGDVDRRGQPADRA